MLDVTLDLITQTASSSLFAFCFCNLIIVIILMGSKPGSEFEQEEKKSPLLEASSASTNVREEKVENPNGFCEERDDLQVVNEVQNEMRSLADEDKRVGDGNNDDDDKGEEAEDGNDDDDDEDELRKRVEEFIQKVNRGWKAELLINSHLVEA